MLPFVIVIYIFVGFSCFPGVVFLVKHELNLLRMVHGILMYKLRVLVTPILMSVEIQLHHSFVGLLQMLIVLILVV